MAASQTIDKHESSEERMQRRRARRWKRRARIAGPFLGLPLLVGALALSVDLITYAPVPPREKLADRPMSNSATEQGRSRATSPQSGISNTPVVEPGNATQTLELELHLDDETASLGRDFAPPTPPYVLRDDR